MRGQSARPVTEPVEVPTRIPSTRRQAQCGAAQAPDWSERCGIRFRPVVFAVGCRPLEDAAGPVVEVPPGEVLHPVVMSAEAGEIPDIRRPAVVPRDRMIEVAGSGASAAAWCPTGAVPQADRALQVGRNAVLVPPDGEHRTGFRLDEDPGEAWCVHRDTCRGLRVDRTVAVEGGRGVARRRPWLSAGTVICTVGLMCSWTSIGCGSTGLDMTSSGVTPVRARAARASACS